MEFKLDGLYINTGEILGDETLPFTGKDFLQLVRNYGGLRGDDEDEYGICSISDEDAVELINTLYDEYDYDVSKEYEFIEITEGELSELGISISDFLEMSPKEVNKLLDML